MKRIQMLLLGLCLSAMPSLSFAEVSLSEISGVDTRLSVELMPDMSSDIAYGYAPGPRPAPAPAPRPVVRQTVVRTAPAPRVVYHRPVRTVRPVVVVEQPSTVVVAANTQATTTVESAPAETRKGSKFGFGIRGAGFQQSAIQMKGAVGDIESELAGGIGYYIKLRPIRWVSVEFINDIIFGRYKEYPSEFSGYDRYIRVPVSLGLRVHVFDYGMLDVYGVAAASASFITVDDGNDSIDQENRFPQFGGQFGGGVSLVAGAFEIGFDLRYTVDQAPGDFGPKGFRLQSDPDKVVHGVIFSLNVGLAL